MVDRRLMFAWVVPSVTIPITVIRPLEAPLVAVTV